MVNNVNLSCLSRDFCHDGGGRETDVAHPNNLLF